MMPLRRAVLVVMGKVSISLPVIDVLPDGKSRQSVHLKAQKWIIKTVGPRKCDYKNRIYGVIRLFRRQRQKSGDEKSDECTEITLQSPP